MENMKFSEIISNYGLVYYTPEIDPLVMWNVLSLIIWKRKTACGFTIN